MHRSPHPILTPTKPKPKILGSSWRQGAAQGLILEKRENTSFESLIMGLPIASPPPSRLFWGPFHFLVWGNSLPFATGVVGAVKHIGAH